MRVLRESSGLQVRWNALLRGRDRAAEAVRADAGIDGDEWEEYRNALNRDHGPTAHVFRCRHCDKLGGIQRLSLAAESIHLEAYSYDSHTHAVAGSREGLLQLAALIRRAMKQEAHLELRALSQEDRPLSAILVSSGDGAIRFSVSDGVLNIRADALRLESLAKSLEALAQQERKPGFSSPRLVPRWFEGDDFLDRESDEVSFLQLPIDPPLARG